MSVNISEGTRVHKFKKKNAPSSPPKPLSVIDGVPGAIIKEDFMSPLHLIWILPLTAAIGFLIGAICSASSRADRMSEEYNNKERK